MKLLHLSAFLLLLIFFSNCDKKKYPDSVTLNASEFYSELNLSTGKITLEAGKNNYRMYSSYSLNEDSLFAYKAELRSQDCNSNCNNSLLIQINGAEKNTAGTVPNINTELRIGNYEFAGPSWEVRFLSSYNKTAAKYFWQFGDGNTSLEQNPTHIYLKGGSYKVCLTITSSNGCESTICNTIDVGYPDNKCAASITAVKGMGGLVQFNIIAKGTPPFQAFWEFGDGNTSNNIQTSNIYSIPGSYRVNLSLTDATGDKAYTSYNVVTSGDSSSCAANFRTLSITKKPALQTQSKVKLVYTDGSGVQYSSDSFISSENSFEILSISEYELNERNEPTKKLNLHFKGYLYNGQNSIRFYDSKATIAISYKN